MTVPPVKPAASRRRPLVFACAGCAVLAACILLALVADGAYWYYKIRVQGGGAPSAPGAARAEWEQLPAGSANAGGQAFNGDGGCSACHSLQPGVKIIGPSLAGVAARAATRKPDTAAELYLYESIAYPEAYVVQGFPGSIMPANFRQRLSEQQLADLIAFLMTK